MNAALLSRISNLVRWGNLIFKPGIFHNRILMHSFLQKEELYLHTFCKYQTYYTPKAKMFFYLFKVLIYKLFSTRFNLSLLFCLKSDPLREMPKC